MTLPAPLDRLAYWAVPLALVVGVLVQRYHVVADAQTAWTGGGFGMFSTVDVPGARLTRAYVLTDQGPALVLEPPYLGESWRLVYTRPTPERLERVASGLATVDWLVYDADAYDQLLPYLPDRFQSLLRSVDAAPPGGAPTLPSRIAVRPGRVPTGVEPSGAVVEGAQIEVWRPRFDREGGRLRPVLLRTGRASRLTLPTP